MTLALLARCRVPQVVLLTEQADPAQNGVYEVVLGYARPTLVRVGAPDRKVVAVELGAGLAVGSTVDPHGFSPVETTNATVGSMRAAFAMPWAVAR
jgi:hypothetical protein